MSRTARLSLGLVLAFAFISGCNCNGGGSDGGTDGGEDAGPPRCATTADCATAGLPDFVCDPTTFFCLPKCTDDSQCSYVQNGYCQKSDGTCRLPCTVEDHCGEQNQLCQSRSGKCVDKCKRDDDCSTIDPGTKCNEIVGACVNAVHPCSMDSDCNNFFEPDDYCFIGGIQCRCVVESNDAGQAGVCKRRRAVCEDCTDPVQCGSGTTFDPMGTCKALPGDTTGKKFCLQAQNGPCGCGFVSDNATPISYCKPQSNSCDMPGCGDDKDCKAGAVCNKASCLCEPRCRWDFFAQDVAAPGCPPGKTCWVDDKNLDPNSIYYGAGRCRPPCTDDTSCTDTTTNPSGGPRLVCKTEKLKGGGMSDKRCRAKGECMDDLECPEQPQDSIYTGYCNRGTFECKTDCRTGLDPVTNKAYRDCRSPYACAADAGTNYCRLQTCVEQGGAAIACNRGEYCCGEDKNGDNQPDPCPPANELGPDKCYTAPRPPFCTTCMSSDDCTNLQLPGYLTGAGACSNGSKSPSCSPYPVLCYQVQKPDMSQVGVCAPATYNDSTRDMNGVGKDSRGCPAGYPAIYTRVRFTNGGDDYCTNDSDCNQGTDAGRCAPDPTLTLRDGGHPLACLCTVGSAKPQCPNTPDGGVSSFCKFGITNETQACMETVSCLPGGAILFTDAGAPNFGCGL